MNGVFVVFLDWILISTYTIFQQSSESSSTEHDCDAAADVRVICKVKGAQMPKLPWIQDTMHLHDAVFQP